MARQRKAASVRSLILIGQFNDVVHSFVLNPHRKYTVGRSSASDIVVRHPSVSRTHAELTLSELAIAIKDLASRNGTFVENSRVTQGKAAGGQRIRFGDVSFLVAAVCGSEDEGSEIPTELCSLPPQTADQFVAMSKLSPAQVRVFDLLVQGFSEKELAARLSLSANTVHHHISAIYRALSVCSRAEFMVRAQAK
jgi:DNA-binding CsgD family transcriptional regulator